MGAVGGGTLLVTFQIISSLPGVNEWEGVKERKGGDRLR